MFLFLSAMFVIVLSDNLEWMFTGWEITTVCSFLMIGYTRTPEAIKNSFRQIILNMIGGIAFLAALFIIHLWGLPLSLASLTVVANSVFARRSSCPSCCSRSPASPRPRRCRSTAGCSRHGGPDPHERPAPLLHDGQGRCLFAR